MSQQHDGARLAPSTEATALVYQFPRIGWERVGEELFPFFADDPERVAHPDDGRAPPRSQSRLVLFFEPLS